MSMWFMSYVTFEGHKTKKNDFEHCLNIELDVLSVATKPKNFILISFEPKK